MRWMLLLLMFSGFVMAGPQGLAVNERPETKNQIIINPSKLDEYRALAAELGLDYDRVYSYRGYANAARLAKIGEAGKYEYLLLSTGGNEFNVDDAMRAIKSPLRWEMNYYSNIDMTIIRGIESDKTNSNVKLLKLARGRVPDLNLK